MVVKKKNIISSSELLEKMNDKNIKILDSRWFLDPKKNGYNEYIKSHIPNSVFFDIDLFSDQKTKLPHMMPSDERLKTLASKIGISNDDHLIIYDQTGFFCSSRVWFMFKVFGHKKISILNGGFENWKKEKLPLEKNKAKSYISNYLINRKKNLIVSKDKILKLMNSNYKNSYSIIDARPLRRFKSLEPEPRKNVRRGNIQKSINIPFNIIHDKNGFILSNEKLKDIFYNNNKLKSKKVICLCGSGVTACNIIFALHLLNHKNNFLYDGSWSEWGAL